MPQRGPEAGFTLVELLVALVLIGMIATLLYSGLRDGARAWRSVEARSQALESVLLAQSFLRDRLTTLAPPEGAGIDGRPGPRWFDGGPDRLAITAPWLETLPVAGLYRMEFAAEDGPNGRGELSFRWSPVPPTAADGRAEEGARTAGERALLDGVRAVRFSYFGQTEEAGAKEWRPEWRSGLRAPELVRVEVAFDDPARAWPTLMIAVP